MGGVVRIAVRDWDRHQMASYLEFVLATPIVLGPALPFLSKRGWGIRVGNRPPTCWTLHQSWRWCGLSLLRSFATFLPASFRKQLSAWGTARQIFRSGVVIHSTGMSAQRLLELRSRVERTGDAIRRVF